MQPAILRSSRPVQTDLSFLRSAAALPHVRSQATQTDSLAFYARLAFTSHQRGVTYGLVTFQINVPLTVQQDLISSLSHTEPASVLSQYDARRLVRSDTHATQLYATNTRSTRVCTDPGHASSSSPISRRHSYSSHGIHDTTGSDGTTGNASTSTHTASGHATSSTAMDCT